MEPYIQDAIVALGIIVLGIIIGKASSSLVMRLNHKADFTSRRSLIKVMRAFRVGIFLLSLIVALSLLNVEFATDLWIKFLAFIPSLFILVIVWLLGYAAISLVFDFATHVLMDYVSDYITSLGIKKNTASMVLSVTKIFLLLIFATISLKVADLYWPIVDWVIIGMIFSFMIFLVISTAYAFKDYVANFMLSTYIERNILKPGQHIKINGDVGEVVSITNHGVVIAFDNGYQMIMPNTEVLKEKLILKRVRSDVHKLGRLIQKYIVQLPAFCGPASVAMMLNFFGYSVTQEQVAKIAKTRAPPKDMLKRNYTTGNYGNEPGELIKAVQQITKGTVKGKLLRYDEITNLKEEVKVWLTEGALPILWYKKPVLFPDKPSKSGHYVLGVGVEDAEIIVMDPSSQTAGVYMVNYEYMEEAMAEHDRERGYIVFAKKGSPAYWRLTEGLYYSDATAYKELSRSFERYLKKTLRESGLVREYISPFVKIFFDPDQEKIKHLWKPNVGDHAAKK